MNKQTMKLTAKEEEIMNLFWGSGALFVRELLDNYGDPKPHFNTLSTIVRGLEEKGFLAHKSYGNSYQYYAKISREAFSEGSLANVIGKYYDNSVFSAVSALVEREAISVDELKKLIDLVEKNS